MSDSPKASSTSPSSSTPSRARSWDGRSTIIWKPSWPSRLSTWRFAARNPPQGLIHHSDRGVQYASNVYAARLDQRGFQRSMSRPGNPYDNAKAESFMKTLKAEEVDGRAYANLEHARRRIGAFIEDVYNADRLHSNADRLHSARGYKSPIAFENELRKTEPAMSSP